MLGVILPVLEDLLRDMIMEDYSLLQFARETFFVLFVLMPVGAKKQNNKLQDDTLTGQDNHKRHGTLSDQYNAEEKTKPLTPSKWTNRSMESKRKIKHSQM